MDKLLIKYACEKCTHEWYDLWDCEVNNDCPACGCRDVEASESMVARECFPSSSGASSTNAVVLEIWQGMLTNIFVQDELKLDTTSFYIFDTDSDDYERIRTINCLDGSKMEGALEVHSVTPAPFDIQQLQQAAK